MNIPIQKLKAIILYFCENTDPKFLGKVKLMKLFYYLDFIHVKKYGSPVTFDRYVKLEHGPIPSVIKNMVDDAECDQDSATLADIIDIDVKDSATMHRITARRKMTQDELDLFSKSELDTLGLVCARFKDKNTEYIERASHEESPWKRSDMFKEIPYTLAAEDADCMASKEEIEMAINLFSA